MSKYYRTKNPYFPSTLFGMHRLRETCWKDREFMEAIVRLEEFARRGGPIPGNYGSMKTFGKYKGRYPVEWKCLLREVQHGVLTSPEEYRELKLAYEEKVRRQLEAYRRQRRREDDQKRRQEEKWRRRWIKAGGLP